MGRRGDILLVLAIFLILPLVSAIEPAFNVPRGENYSLKFSCNIDGSMCTNDADCNITIDYPNSTFLLKDTQASMIKNAEFLYNLTKNNTRIPGEHRLKIDCIDGNLNGTSTIFYQVNAAGIRSTEERTNTISRSVYFIFIIGILFFLAFLFTKDSPPIKWTFFILTILFWLISLNLLFVSLQDEVVNPKLINFFDGFTVISWYFYWFAGGLLAIIWFFAFLNTWIFKKNMRNAKRYGLA